MAQRVLVVDDEPAILELVSFNLRKEGYDVLTASDGNAALSVFRAEKPDLVILDLMIPDPDGYEVCRQIRAESSVPVIMLTARTEERDRVKGLDIGADDYVVKPLARVSCSPECVPYCAVRLHGRKKSCWPPAISSLIRNAMK